MKKSAKKIAMALVLTSICSLTIFAGDGSIPTGGKSCPPNQTCLVQSPDLPQTETEPVFTKIFDYLKSIFG
ncbi:MAG: hypothetical protein LUM44_04610 [Pyrinomonadaceae bacterium]|nr:hypothetical protein [Pyrinomonadaceae bacterium]